MTSHMTNSRRISILKRPLNFYFLAFGCIIYQNLLHIRVYIAVSSSKLLFINFVKNRCISPLMFDTDHGIVPQYSSCDNSQLRSSTCGNFTVHQTPLCMADIALLIVKPYCHRTSNWFHHVPDSARNWRRAFLDSASFISFFMPSVLWHCWLGGRKGIRPVKTEWWGTGLVIWLEWGANDLHMVQLMPLPPHYLLLQ